MNYKFTATKDSDHTIGSCKTKAFSIIFYIVPNFSLINVITIKAPVFDTLNSAISNFQT